MSFTIRIHMAHAKNAALLEGALPSEYSVIRATHASAEDAHSFDLCVLDYKQFLQLSPMLFAWKSKTAPLFLPFLLLCEQREYPHLSPHVWEVVDTVVTMPVSKAELVGRIRMLLRTRQSSIECSQLAQELEKHPPSVEQTVSDSKDLLEEILEISLELSDILAPNLQKNEKKLLNKIIELSSLDAHS